VTHSSREAPAARSTEKLFDTRATKDVEEQVDDEHHLNEKTNLLDSSAPRE
jgi:hypothetical protein